MKNRVWPVAAALMAVIIIGTAGYTIIEGWPVFDSLFMTVITVGTVGYGETHPLSTAGRVFTIFLIAGGLGIVAYAFSMFTAMIVEGEIKQALRRRKMEKQIANFRNHYIVCGAGPTGRAICEELYKTGRPFVVIEKDQQHAKRLESHGYLVVLDDAMEDEALKKAGIEHAYGVFCALGSDRDNAFVSLSARGLNPKIKIVGEQVDEGVREKLLRSGTDAVVNPRFIGGLRMASEMIRPAAVGFMDAMIRGQTEGTYRIEEIEILPGSILENKPVKNIKTCVSPDTLALAVRNAKAVYEINPSPERLLKAGETVVVLANSEKIQKLDLK